MDDAPPAKDEEERALRLAHRALAARERTVAELRTWLERKRMEPSAIDAVVAELCESGILDDERYARAYTEDKRELERWGSERIERDLLRRGVAPEVVAAAVGGRGRADELETALLLLERRMTSPPANERERDRAWRVLIRRGYEPEVAYEAVRVHERRLAAGNDPL